MLQYLLIKLKIFLIKLKFIFKNVDFKRFSMMKKIQDFIIFAKIIYQL